MMEDIVREGFMIGMVTQYQQKQWRERRFGFLRVVEDLESLTTGEEFYFHWRQSRKLVLIDGEIRFNETLTDGGYPMRAREPMLGDLVVFTRESDTSDRVERWAYHVDWERIKSSAT